MIAALMGTVLGFRGSALVVMTSGGVGYCVHVLPSCRDTYSAGAFISLQIETILRENDMSFYGFEDNREREAFVLLTSVQSVGARVAFSLLSLGDVSVLFRAIAQKKTSFLTKASGVGAKLADRIILELHKKSEVSMYAEDEKTCVEPETEVWRDVRRGLLALSFSTRDVEHMMVKAHITSSWNGDKNDAIRACLKTRDI